MENRPVCTVLIHAPAHDRLWKAFLPGLGVILDDTFSYPAAADSRVRFLSMESKTLLPPTE